MSDTLATLTKEAVALSYEERIDLLNSLAASLYNRDESVEKSARVQNRLDVLKKYSVVWEDCGQTKTQWNISAGCGRTGLLADHVFVDTNPLIYILDYLTIRQNINVP